MSFASGLSSSSLSSSSAEFYRVNPPPSPAIHKRPKLQEEEDQFIRRTDIAASWKELGSLLDGEVLDEELIDVLSRIEEEEALKDIGQRAHGTIKRRYTPLHDAVKVHDRKTVTALLKNGALQDLNRSDSTGKTPLEYALERKPFRGEVATVLLQYGADPAKLPSETKQKYAGFFNERLIGSAQYLHIPTCVVRKQAQLGVQKLSKEQEVDLKQAIGLNLKMVQNIVNADIPGLNVRPITAQCNHFMTQVNNEIENIWKHHEGSTEEKIACVQKALLTVRPILHTGLPLNVLKLKEYAHCARNLCWVNPSASALHAEAKHARRVSKNWAPQSVRPGG